jgi:hypothetical protein
VSGRIGSEAVSLRVVEANEPQLISKGNRESYRHRHRSHNCCTYTAHLHHTRITYTTHTHHIHNTHASHTQHTRITYTTHTHHNGRQHYHHPRATQERHPEHKRCKHKVSCRSFKPHRLPGRPSCQIDRLHLHHLQRCPHASPLRGPAGRRERSATTPGFPPHRSPLPFQPGTGPRTCRPRKGCRCSWGV